MKTFNIVAPTVRNTDNTYFEENQKNELGQLKKLFRQVISVGDQPNRIKLVRTIIAYTTLGLDTSRLFPEIILASHTSDLIEKKLIFFYLSIYSEQYPEIALMAINTFRKDCVHSDSRIRGLSLKSLCSLRFKGAYEYVYPCIQQGLKDRDAYVRRSAVLGLAKVFRLYKQIKDDVELLDTVYALIKDEDKLVASNAIQTLNQLLHEEGGIAVTQKMAAYLLNNLNSFPQFAQIIVLQTIQKYTPANQNEMIAIMNILDGKLKHSSSSTILATIKVFLKFSTLNESLKAAILLRAKAPLVFLVTSQPGFEISYIVLEHIRYLVNDLKCHQLFLSHYKIFFCQADEPTFTRKVKIQILQHLTSDTNISDVINELDQYINQEQIISVVAIRALGHIAAKVSLDECRLIMKIMLKKVESGSHWICNQIVLVLEDVIRKHPEEFQIVKTHITALIQHVSEPDAKASILSMISKYGQAIGQTREFIESLIGNEKEFNNYPSTLKKQILNTSLNQFFKSPGYQIKRLLGSVFTLVINNPQTEIHLKDLASMYYIAMQTDMNGFQQSFMGRRESTGITQAQPVQLCFNTFEIPFRKPSELFLTSPLVSLDTFEFDPQMTEPKEQLREIIIDLNPKFKMLEVDDFQEQFTMETDAFQQMWEQLPECACMTRIIQQVQGITDDNMEQLFRLWRIYTIASSQKEQNLKTYLYTKQVDKDGQQGHIGLMVFQVQKDNKMMTLTTKCSDQEFAGFISKYIQEFLKINEII